MKTHKMLSILIITYNQENFIKQTLDSILNQDYSFPFEIIIGDDCSKDNTRKIISEYKEKFPEEIVISFNKENLGIVKNYFNVLSQASGKYIMECAGDDWWLPGKVSKQINFMENNPDVGMCYGKAKGYLNSKKKYEKKSVGEKCENFSQLLEGNQVPALSVCFRKELSDKYIHDIDPVSKGWLMEDAPMWLWFAAESKIKFIDDYFGVYRIIESSGSHFTNVEKFLRFENSAWDKKDFFSRKYLGKPAEPWNIHPDLFKIYLLNNDRMNAVKEIKQIGVLGVKGKLKFFMVSNPFFFKIYRLWIIAKN